MKVLTKLVPASVLGMARAVARADVPVVKKAPTAKAQAATTDVAPVKVSQQVRMRLCAKRASGKTGAERKAFMKTCLATKKAQARLRFTRPMRLSGDSVRRLGASIAARASVGRGLVRSSCARADPSDNRPVENSGPPDDPPTPRNAR
jgi:hypothetical protein